MLALLLSLAISPATVVHVPVAPAETLAVTLEGTGPPVILIPGMLGGAYGFRKVTAQLAAAGRRVLVVDPLGTGGSSQPPDADYSMAAQARRVAAVLDSLGVRHAIVVAHAVGTPIALRLALQRPDLVAGILSINGSASEETGSSGLRLALHLAPVLKLFGGHWVLEHKLVAGLRASSADPAWVTHDVVAAYTRPYAQDLDRTLQVLQRMADTSAGPPLLQRLAGVRCPVVLLLGTGGPTPALGADEVAAMAAHLPGLRVDTLPYVGEYIQEEQPGLVTEAILALQQQVDRHRSGILAGPPEPSPTARASDAPSRAIAGF